MWSLNKVCVGKFQTLLVIFLCFSWAQGLSYEEDIKITKKEKAALERFKSLVIPEIPASSYIQNYVTDDLYFLRWLRAKLLDVRAAERMFLEHLKWRENHKIDLIHTEDFSSIEREFPIYGGSVDKEGRPITEMWFAEWNVRKAVLSGRSKELLHWTAAKMFELPNRSLYEARHAGKNVSQALLIVEVDGFNLIQQGCPSCLPISVNIASQLENHYPNIWESIYLANMPSSFGIVLTAVTPILRPSTRKAIKSLPDREQWTKIFDDKIDEDQRSIRFGGAIARES